MSISQLQPLDRLRYAIGIAYSLAVASMMIAAGEPAAIWWWLFFAPFYLWCLAPIIVGLFFPFKSWLVIGSVGAMAGYSAYVYYRDMFGPDVRSTSALIFLFLPAYQWIAVIVLFAFALTVRKLARR